MPTKKVAAAVQISKPDFRFIALKIRGTAPLVINRFSHKAMEEMKATQEAGSTSRSKKVREAKDFGALYAVSYTHLTLPTICSV